MTEPTDIDAAKDDALGKQYAYFDDFLVLAKDIRTEEQLLYAYAWWVVALHDGNKSRAARALGIDRRSLYRRLGIKFNSDKERDAARP